MYVCVLACVRVCVGGSDYSRLFNPGGGEGRSMGPLDDKDGGDGDKRWSGALLALS